jgi:hypothetical protein
MGDVPLVNVADQRRRDDAKGLAGRHWRLIGIVVAVFGELHRRRMARIQETNNTLLNELIDAIRDDTENRQDVKELIRTIREAPR